jgi:hypothetical protein
MIAGDQVNVNSEWNFILKGAASISKRAVGMPDEVEYCETDEQLVNYSRAVNGHIQYVSVAKFAYTWPSPSQLDRTLS